MLSDYDTISGLHTDGEIVAALERFLGVSVPDCNDPQPVLVAMSDRGYWLKTSCDDERWWFAVFTRGDGINVTACEDDFGRAACKAALFAVAV